MEALEFTVLTGPWTALGEEYADHVGPLEDPDPELVRLAHHAHAAGVLVVEGADDASLAEHGVQSQEDGEAAYDAAWRDGSWREGHTLQVAYDAVAKAEDDAARAAEEAGEDPTEAASAVDPAKVPVRISDGGTGPVVVKSAAEIIAAFEAGESVVDGVTIGAGDVADLHEVLGGGEDA